MSPLKKAWIEKLRSGEVKQGRGQLRGGGISGDCFCCLGVLADLIDPNWGHDGWIHGAPGLSESIIDDAHQKTLVHMNDGDEIAESCSFAEIADYLEAHPEIEVRR